MPTAKVLVERAMRTINVLEGGNEADPQEIADGLVHLREMLEQWSLGGILVPTVQIVAFSLDTLKRDYTWGPGGDFDAARPAEILMAVQIDGAGNRFVTTVIDGTEWLSIPRVSDAGRPQQVWIDNDAPLRNVRFDRYPIDTHASFAIRGPLAAPATVTDEMVLHPGYAAAIRYQLAMQLAPEFAVEITADLRRAAARAKNLIAAKNMELSRTTIDRALWPGGDMGDFWGGPG